ncbi:MAG: hypothetical protein Q8N05_05500 [Bacteroidota bacterium]|nr:hypothetical protein [Bacteroidota bacterium]
MQIDFHHAVTYIIARLAGFSADEAAVVAYSSQYVDDAVNNGLVRFSNDAYYSRISSAHKLIDLRNFRPLANRFAMLPFHFLPGNGGKKPGEDPDGTFIQKLVCTPGSFVARDMVALCIFDADEPYALHRLGITMHVFADTFAHQEFAGVSHQINEVKELDSDGILEQKKSWQDKINSIKSLFIGKVLPLGHGAALTCPDLPFLKWQYTNGLNKKIERNNPLIFKQAIESIFQIMVRFRRKDPEYIVTQEIPKQDLDQIERNILAFRNVDGKIRHQNWIDSIFNGDFSFAEKGEEKITYFPKGTGSWKYEALGTERKFDLRTDRFPYHDSFLTSNWRYFHDALQKHRLAVLRDILPKYGICAA